MKATRLVWLLVWQYHSTLIQSFAQRNCCVIHNAWRNEEAQRPIQSTLLGYYGIQPRLYMARSKRISNLMDWAQKVDIQMSGSIQLQETPETGVGLHLESPVENGSLLLTVPSDAAIVTESSSDEKYPWYVQMAMELKKIQQQNNHTPWLEALPKSFSTPIHWSTLEHLQYDPMVRAVEKQKHTWRTYHQNIPTSESFPESEFVYWCEIARSRGFSGSYGGTAFNPNIYAFTLVLVTFYLLLNLGTLEQAANGAGVVFSVSILKDFVIPKLFRKKRYCVCPIIDMANHKSDSVGAKVSFEYFGNAYSLESTAALSPGSELFISYGDRSNDQLLQYYGFVETDNPHDVYILPSTRDWDLAALERSCGRSVASGRLVDLAAALEAFDETGVVLSRKNSIDPSAMQTIRALFATEKEWKAAGCSVGAFQNVVSAENEGCARTVVASLIEYELSSKPSSLEQDRKTPTTNMEEEEILAVQFRIEKKKLLLEQLQAFRSQSH